MKHLNHLITILLVVVLQILGIDSVPGKSLEFDGINDYVELPDSTIGNPTGSFTVEIWTKLSEFKTGSVPIMSKHSNDGIKKGYTIEYDEIYGVRAVLANSSDWQRINGSHWNLNEWHRLVITFDDDLNLFSFYDNGEFMGSSITGEPVYSEYDLRIGSSQWYNVYYPGIIDEVRMWNRALSINEVRENMFIAADGTETGLMCLWQFNDGSGAILSDSVSGYDGTLYNMDDTDWVQSTIPFGSGTSDLKIISSTGTYDFAGTGISMDVTSKTGTDTIVVSRLNLSPNTLPTGIDDTYDSQYWVINSFGGGSTASDISYVPEENIETAYETKPVLIKLYGRSLNSDTVWFHTKDASNVNASANIAEFSGISEFGQFILSREYLPYFTMLNNPAFILITEFFSAIDVGSYSSPAFTDLDGDGLLDLLVGEYPGYLNHYEQTAPNSISFTLVTEHFNGIYVGSSLSPAFTDLDGDGLLDLLIGESDGNINHYEQTAPNSISFTLVTESFGSIDVGNSSKPAFTDLDDDGLLDLLIGERDGNINHYEQTAPNSTSFTLVTQTFNGIDVGERSKPAFTDLDDDGLLDLLIGEYYGKLNHYEQTAPNSTSFSLVTKSFDGIDVGDISSPVFTDIDDDGLLDLLIGEVDGNINRYEETVISEINFGKVVPGRFSVKKYNIEANNLVSDLNLSVSSEFTISLSEDTGYSNNLSVTPADGKISCLIYVKFNPSYEADFGCPIIHTTDFCETRYITLSGSGGYLDKIPGTALEFDGINDYVTVSDNNNLDLTDNYTIEAWIKPAGFSAMAGIVSKYQTLGANGYYLRLNNVSPYTGLTFDELSTENGLLEEEKWYHIAAVNDNGTRHLYVNGIEINITGTPLVVNQNTNPLRIGIDFLSNPRYFNGKIDEVRLWNTVRSLQEIRQYMNSPLIGNETGLISCWQLNGGTGTSVEDPLNSNNGTMSNMDDSNWVNSTIPFGEGNIYTQIVSSTGTVDFTETGITIDFTEKTGTDTIVVKQINLTPNIDPVEPDSTFNSQYWVIHKFGNGTLTGNISITVSEDLTADDVSNPTCIKLYTRTATSDSSWSYQASSAQVDSTANSATFNSVTEFGQLIICKGDMDVPLNVTTEIIGTDIRISWDAVPGATSYKVFTSDDPYGSFTDISGSGIFDGTSWSIEYAESRKFYYVIAVTSAKAGSNNRK